MTNPAPIGPKSQSDQKQQELPATSTFITGAPTNGGQPVSEVHVPTVGHVIGGLPE